MADVVVNFREPFYPHPTIAEARPTDIRYGFLLHRPSRMAFRLSRADTNNADAFALGAAITIERDDEVLPWFGYITERIFDARSAEVQFIAQDLAGSLFEMAVTPMHWSERSASSGQIIREVFQDAQGRAEPPIQIELPNTFGPVVNYTPRAETLLSFLRTMERWTGWEWGLRSRVESDRVITELLWQERLGFDRATEVFLEDRVHVSGLRLTQQAEGFIQRGIAVGGGGTFSGRTAATVSISGAGFQGAEPQRLDTTDPPAPTSPALSGTRVVVDTQITNVNAATLAARRLHQPEEHVREQLDFEVVESRVDMTQFDLGSSYSLRYADLAFDRDVERRFRIQALSLGTEGRMGVVAEIEREKRPEIS